MSAKSLLGASSELFCAPVREELAANAELADGVAFKAGVLSGSIDGVVNCGATNISAGEFLWSVRRSAKARASGLSGMPPKRDGGTVIGTSWNVAVKAVVSPDSVAPRAYMPTVLMERSLKTAKPLTAATVVVPERGATGVAFVTCIVTSELSVVTMFPRASSTATTTVNGVLGAAISGCSTIASCEAGRTFTVTTMLLVAVKPSGSVIVAVKLYEPAFVKLAVIFWAALVPLVVPV